MEGDYNKNWCDERHKKITEEFGYVWDKIKTLEGRLWAIIVLLVFNLGGVIISIMLKMP